MQTLCDIMRSIAGCWFHHRGKLALLIIMIFVTNIWYYMFHSKLLKDTTDDKKNRYEAKKTRIYIDWETINVNKRSDISYDKWIVFTTINPPTEDVKKLAKIPGWKVVVVGDTKSPKTWSLPNCIHLNVDEQLQLGYKITKLLEFKSYARKSIGFLYAIQHGAKVIYETDDDNSPTSGDIGFDPDSSHAYLVYEARNRYVVNPYAHFGQSSIWPRGYPLDRVGDEPIHTFRSCNSQRALVQQGVVNGDPDVDAIYRLTRKDAGINLNVSFDSTAEPVLLPKGIMAPYNSQNTLHLNDAFWGLLLPQTVAFRVCDIWRGYWTQRLLWEINGNLAFFPPNAFTVRNSHDYLTDLIDEKQLYQESSAFVKFLTQWKASKETFFDRIVELSYDMADHGFWGYKDVELVEAWLVDLIRIGYKPPKVNKPSKVCHSKVRTILPNEQASSYLRGKDKLKFL